MPRARNGRWPEYAEEHRLDADAAAHDIMRLAAQAQAAAAHGRNLETAILLQRIGRRAEAIRAALLLAREGKPSDRDDPGRPDDLDVLEQVEQVLQDGKPPAALGR